MARLAMLLAPLAVLPLGLAVAAVCGLGGVLGLPGPAVGLLAVAVLLLGTRALHVDGLSDTVDGLSASFDPARSLAVMRTGPSGPAGGAAVLLVLGLQAAGFAALAGRPVLAGLVVCVARCSLALACARGVRSAHEGLGRPFVGTVPPAAAALSWLLAAGVLAAVVAASGGSWWLGPLACALAVLVVAWLVRRTTRRLGGVTGDVLGAAVELSLATLVLAVA